MIKSMKAHSERLQRDLDDALVRIEVDKAKAGMYDHLLYVSDTLVRIQCLRCNWLSVTSFLHTDLPLGMC